jgi:hypothetical protein
MDATSMIRRYHDETPDRENYDELAERRLPPKDENGLELSQYTGDFDS